MNCIFKPLFWFGATVNQCEEVTNEKIKSNLNPFMNSLAEVDALFATFFALKHTITGYFQLQPELACLGHTNLGGWDSTVAV